MYGPTVKEASGVNPGGVFTYIERERERERERAESSHLSVIF